MSMKLVKMVFLVLSDPVTIAPAVAQPDETGIMGPAIPMGTLLQIRRGDSVRTIPFSKNEIKLGRGTENDVVLPDDLASRNHAVLTRRPDGFWVRDLGSRNGTRIRGELLTGPERLVPGEAFQIGRHLISVEAEVGAGAPRTRPSGNAEEVLTADDLVEVDDEVDAYEPGGLDALSAVVASEGDTPMAFAPGVPVEPAEPAMRSVFDESDDDDSAEEQLAKLAANLPNQTFESSAIEMTDASGQVVHGTGTKAGAKKKPVKGDAVEMLRSLLLVCYRGRATDLHLEPRQDGHHVRLRIDGLMVDVARMPAVTGSKLATVVKILCQIDIAQRKSIQEGSFAARVPDGGGKFRRIDYRVSFAPAVLGQKLVVRILDASAAPSRLADLNMPPAMTEQVARTLKRDSGMILVAGPTGSGKTTTLYSLLRSIDLTRLNVVTIEDPVEVHLEGGDPDPGRRRA